MTTFMWYFDLFNNNLRLPVYFHFFSIKNVLFNVPEMDDSTYTTIISPSNQNVMCVENQTSCCIKRDS